MRHLLVALLLFTSIAGFSQEGTVRGKVYDGKTGETLVGVTVWVEALKTGTTTDLDGKFTLKLKEGTYNLRFTFISYQKLTIKDVKVKADEVKVFNNLRLQRSSTDLQEVVVTANAVRSTETALTAMKKKNASIMDGVSARKMQLIGDATAAEAAKRITGVSVEDGKYFFIRGLGDRYSQSMLNNMDIPGLDPDRNTIQMDIFPSSLMANMIVKKNFTAELPADFTGGLLNIETKDFPDRKFFDVSVGISYNPSMHFNNDYLAYKGGSTDFLGFDDGTRALPDGAGGNNIPTPISGASEEEVVDFVNSFNPELAAKEKTSLPGLSAGISLGNQIDLEGSAGKSPKLGYIFSLSYKSDIAFYDDVQYGEYQRHIDPETYEMRYATRQHGALGEHNVLLGALGGLAYKTNNSKIRLTSMHLQSGVSKAGQFSIANDGQAVGQSGYTAASDNLEYSQRSLSNVMLNGTHVHDDSGWELDWRVAPTLSISNDPDIRKTAFTQSPVDTLFMAGAGGNPTRIWRSLQEWSIPVKADVTKKYSFNDARAKLKFGASYTYKQRDYEILFFDIQFFGGQDWENPDPANVLNDAYIYPNRPNSIYYQSGNNTPNPNAYKSSVNNTAFYVSNEMEVLPGLKTILGLRAENYVQRHTGRDQRYASGDTRNGRNLDNEKVLESLDLFPSVNFIYALTENQNIRAAYTRTIARPSFKELSFAQILDPMTNRIFNGSLFTYSDWDGKLTETRISNYDLRWELFLEKGQLFSVSAFYKQFDKPIELVRIPEQQTSTEYQPRNVGDGKLYGLEVEFRKNLAFVAPALKHFNVNGNVTVTESEIDMTEAEFNARKTYEKEGQTIADTRSMAGQSPYLVNAGIRYRNSDIGLEAGAFYNVKGPTLSVVGGGLFPDIYTLPFHSLNFTVNKTFGEKQKTSIDLKASNVFNEKRETVYRSFRAKDQIYSLRNPGMSFSVGISHKF